jgi:hypothetical protein
MRKIFWLTFAGIIFLSCSSFKDSRQHVMQSGTNKIPDNVQASNRFRQFWDILAQSTENFTKLSSYLPTDKQTVDFNLKKRGKQYYVNGFLKTGIPLTEKQLAAFSGNINTYAPGMYGYSIPLSEIPQLIQLPALRYIDLSTKVFPRK